MKNKAFRSISFISLVLVLFPFSQVVGQTQRRIARDFVKSLEQTKKVVLITEPDYIYMYNLKKDILKKFPGATKEEQDSLLWAHSDFIKQISDSTFFVHFMKGFTKELITFNLVPYINKVPMGITDPTYKVDLAQVELEEQYYPFVDTAYYNDKALVFRKDLNALDFSMWFKIHSLPQAKKDTTVLFAEYLLSDMVNDGSFFMQNNGSIVYYYKMDRLTIKKIYNYVENLGRIYAGYTFDYILNQYIQNHVTDYNKEKDYWHYDPYNKKLYTDNENRFINIKD